MKWKWKEIWCQVFFFFWSFPGDQSSWFTNFPKRQLLRTKHFAPHLSGTFILYCSLHFSSCLSFLTLPFSLVYWYSVWTWSLSIIQNSRNNIKFLHMKKFEHQEMSSKYLLICTVILGRASLQSCATCQTFWLRSCSTQRHFLVKQACWLVNTLFTILEFLPVIWTNLYN